MLLLIKPMRLYDSLTMARVDFSVGEFFTFAQSVADESNEESFFVAPLTHGGAIIYGL